MCDPVTLGAALAASVGGGIMTSQNALSNAQAQANARNGVLSETIGGLHNIYNNINAPAFTGALSGYNNDAGLTGAQASRTATNLSNIPGVPATMPGTPGDSPAVAKAYQTAYGNANNLVTNQAEAKGTLGGYGDSLFNAGLGAAAGSRTIGVGNAQAENLKSLLGPEQDLAAQEAYKNPSIFGSLLTGLGSILGSAAGGGKGIGSLLGGPGGASTNLTYPGFGLPSTTDPNIPLDPNTLEF